MKKWISVSLILTGFLTGLFAQNNQQDVLMNIAGREITLGEFERVYKKNNSDNVIEKQSVDEYLDMFINYKLKVIEAEEKGMDTAQQFLNEFNSYKSQLAQPYLTSEELTQKFAMEAYERMKVELHASHIMVRLMAEATPTDTAYAYNKIMNIRKRIIQGEDFEQVARATSDDPSAKTNAGDLGWFSAFRMVYPFESAAFNTPAGKISMPVRSSYGYHIIKVHEKRPTMGARKVAHIFIRVPESMSVEEAEAANKKIYAVYDKLKEGADFSQMAREYSDDQSTGSKGGVLPWFNSGQMIPAFDSTAFALKEKGDFSKPVKSSYGWHIVKLLDTKTVGSFDEEKPEILSNIKKGDRGKTRDKAFINNLKKEYGYSFHKDNYMNLLSTLDSSVFQATWDPQKAEAYFALPVFTIGDHSFTVQEFSEYFKTKLFKRTPMSFEVLLNSHYEKFEESSILSYEESQLPKKYPEFKYIVQEYHDGILLFDLTDKMVWKKAVEDTTGLENYYAKHKNSYKWDKRADVCSIVLKDSTLSINEVQKKALRFIKKNKFNPDSFAKQYCKNDTTESCVSVACEKFEPGDNEKVDGMNWKKGSTLRYTENGKPAFKIIAKILKPTVKDLNQTRGIVIADYQKYLEDEWIKSLRNKYNISVNKDLLTKIQD